MKLAGVVLALSVLALTAAPLCAASEEPHPWLPSQSYAGNSLADTRLDEPVWLWATGKPLREVFAGIQQQTGVTLGVWPTEGGFDRACANLYLNPEKPPTLRDVMVQLAWALDGSWGYVEEEGKRTYYLLGPRLGEDISDRLRPEAQVEEDHARIEETRAKLPARWAEVEGALSLGREEAIHKYRGRDDILLLISLDPSRRALAQFILHWRAEHPGDDTLEFGPGRRYSELDEQSRAYLVQAVKGPMAQMASRLPGLAAFRGIDPTDPGAALAKVNPYVSMAEAVNPDEARVSMRLPRVGAVEVELPLLGLMSGQDLYDLRKALGEEVPPGTVMEAGEKLFGLQVQERDRRRLMGLLAQDHLSPEHREQLASLELALSAEGKYPLWQVQEAVAKASGINIVSDCYWQGPRDFARVMKLLYPEARPNMTALLALQVSTIADRGRWWVLHGTFARPSANAVTWEARSAGAFLSFRSAERDLWRGAFLSVETLAALDRASEPCLSEAKAGAEVRAPVDWRALAPRTARLTPAQQKWGGVLTYEDPTDGRNALRQSYRTQVLEAAASQPCVMRLLTSLSEKQWEGLRGEALRIGEDVPLSRLVEMWRARAGETGVSVQSAIRLATSSLIVATDTSNGNWMDFRDGELLRVRASDRAEWRVQMTARQHPDWDDLLSLEVVRDGKVRDSFVLPGRVRLRPPNR